MCELPSALQYSEFTRYLLPLTVSVHHVQYKLIIAAIILTILGVIIGVAVAMSKANGN